MSLVSGSLGKYQIIREIARSNDVVYEAYDPALNRRVALKELLVPIGATTAQAADRVRRFEREARAAGTLSHPNIVTIYEVGHDGDRHFIAMEYLEGESLRQRLDNVGALGEAEATRVMSQVLEGLAYAHDKGIVHRDIKPDNILILPDGRVKITDFGIARITFETKLTVTGQIFGTPSYMSPEQVHGEDVDVRSDVWSAGVVFYEAICGAKPFAGGSVIAIAQSVLHDNPPDPPSASYGIVELIRTALNKSPDARFANAGVMLNALRGQSQLVAPPPVQQAVGSPYPQQQQVFVPPGGQQQTKSPASLAGWGISVALAVLVLFLMVRQTDTVNPTSDNLSPPARHLPSPENTSRGSTSEASQAGDPREQRDEPRRVGGSALYWHCQRCSGQFNAKDLRSYRNYDLCSDCHVQTAKRDIVNRIEFWRESWSSKNIDLYMSCYAPDFQSGWRNEPENRNLDYDRWHLTKLDKFARSRWIHVSISNLTILVDGNVANIRFRQMYDGVSNKGRKTDVGTKYILMVDSGTEWLIRNEEWVKE